MRVPLPPFNFEPLLPPDNRLRSELIAPLYDQSTDKVRIDTKEKVKERLGFSPDMGDAIAYSLFYLDDLEYKSKIRGLVNTRPPKKIAVWQTAYSQKTQPTRDWMAN